LGYFLTQIQLPLPLQRRVVLFRNYGKVGL
jgi:hypothetical protein